MVPLFPIAWQASENIAHVLRSSVSKPFLLANSFILLYYISENAQLAFLVVIVGIVSSLLD